MKKKRVISILAIFTFGIFALLNSLGTQKSMDVLNSSLESLVKEAHASSESGDSNKRPLKQKVSTGEYCCGNTQRTSCGAVSCDDL